MPAVSNPQRRDWHVDHPLTDFAVGWWQEQATFASRNAFSLLRTESRSGLWRELSRADLARVHVRARHPGTAAVQAGFRVNSTRAYVLAERAVAQSIALDDLRESSDEGFDLARKATRFVSSQLMLAMERDWVTAFFAAVPAVGAWGEVLTGVAVGPGAGQFLQWNDPNSDILQDINNAAVRLAERSAGNWPTTLSVDPRTDVAIRLHPDVRDSVKHTEDRVVSDALIAQLFKLKSYVVATSVINTAQELAAAEALAFALPRGALLTFSPKDIGQDEATAGLTALWKNHEGADAESGIAMREFIDEPTKSLIVEGSIYYDFLQVAAVCGTFFAAPVA